MSEICRRIIILLYYYYLEHIGHWKGKKFSKAHKKHLSLALKGRKLSATHKKNVSKGIRKWWSIPENKERMIKAHEGNSSHPGWHQPQSAKEKISAAMKQYWKKRKKNEEGK